MSSCPSPSYPLVVLLAATLFACGPLVELAPQGGLAGPGTPGASLPPTPTQWPTPVNQPWRTVAIGVELRDQPVAGPHFRFPATAHMVRLDPTLVKIHVHYSPEVPITITDWQRETRASVVVNGGFFDAARRTQGLMIGFREPYGDSYAVGGMFYIQNGQVGLRDLSQQPYRRDEQLDEAMQSYPMLVSNGVAVHPFEEYRYNRRTAIAIDSLGRAVLIVFDEPVVSLNELSRWLAASDLELQSAVNLDGGSSTGLAVVTDVETLIIDSGVQLPIVIAAYP